MPKMVQFGQTELPDRPVLKVQKLVENAKIQKFKCDILGDFQTLWEGKVVALESLQEARL